MQRRGKNYEYELLELYKFHLLAVCCTPPLCTTPAVDVTAVMINHIISHPRPYWWKSAEKQFQHTHFYEDIQNPVRKFILLFLLLIHKKEFNTWTIYSYRPTQLSSSHEEQLLTTPVKNTTILHISPLVDPLDCIPTKHRQGCVEADKLSLYSHFSS